MEQKNKAKTIDDIDEQINREYILSVKEITPGELEQYILKAKSWMLDNPKKITDWVLRTGRILQFVKECPDKATEHLTREF